MYDICLCLAPCCGRGGTGPRTKGLCVCALCTLSMPCPPPRPYVRRCGRVLLLSTHSNKVPPRLRAPTSSCHFQLPNLAHLLQQWGYLRAGNRPRPTRGRSTTTTPPPASPNGSLPLRWAQARGRRWTRSRGAGMAGRSTRWPTRCSTANASATPVSSALRWSRPLRARGACCPLSSGTSTAAPAIVGRRTDSTSPWPHT